MNKKIFLSSPTMCGKEIGYVYEAFESNWIAPLGPNVTMFENEIAEYVHCEKTLALASGTAALHLALKLCDVQPGDIVFCQSLTFSASANPIKYLGGTPVFIDSEEQSWNMSPEALEIAFEKYPNPKAVIIVHLYGTPAKISEIKAICDKHNVPLVEDSAEALGATYKGKFTGTFGKYGIYSFNGNKIITSSGGGMLVGNPADCRKALYWATQSRDPAPWYQHSELGYNYRLSNVSAGIGRGQLRAIDSFINKKIRIYDEYNTAFQDIPEITMNPSLPESRPIRWLSALLLSPGCKTSPMELLNELASKNIESRPIWKPLHLQPYYADCDYITTGRSVCDDIFNRGLCLPSDVKNTTSDMKFITETISKAIIKGRSR